MYEVFYHYIRRQNQYIFEQYFYDLEQRQRGKGTTEDLYFWYKKQCKLGMTKSEYQMFKTKK